MLLNGSIECAHCPFHHLSSWFCILCDTLKSADCTQVAIHTHFDATVAGTTVQSAILISYAAAVMPFGSNLWFRSLHKDAGTHKLTS